ncbi:hypothetical protein C9439_05160 [archaeon SCG-AAA382B04]|nr:hypothetical protein C9439_05160 [archaeon SCG-AAA382B04]
MLDAIKQRRSIRKFKEKDIEDQKLREVIKAGCFAPSAKHKYPYKILVVKDDAKKAKLSKITPYASFLAQAPVGLILVSDDVDQWIEDCSVVAENVQLEATNQGLGSCWIQIKGHETEEETSEEVVKEVLSIPGEKRVLAILAIGYPDETKSPHGDGEFDEREVYIGEYGREF